MQVAVYGVPRHAKRPHHARLDKGWCSLQFPIVWLLRSGLWLANTLAFCATAQLRCIDSFGKHCNRATPLLPPARRFP